MKVTGSPHAPDEFTIRENSSAVKYLELIRAILKLIEIKVSYLLHLKIIVYFIL